MALDASSELYIVPFKSAVENRYHNLCKNGTVVETLSDGSKDLLKIRITDLTQDLESDAMPPIRINPDSIGNDYGAVMRHQEIDFESLNQILCKDVVFMSSNPEDTSEVELNEIHQNDLRNFDSLPVIMLSKEQSEPDLVSSVKEISSGAVKGNSQVNLDHSTSDEYIVYKDQNDILSSVQVVLGVDSMEEMGNVWISDQCLDPLSDVKLNSSELLHSESVSSHLVPVKLEDNVVFITASPSSNVAMKSSKRSLPTRLLKKHCTDGKAQDRPSVISIAVPDAVSDDTNQEETVIGSHLLLQNSTFSSTHQNSNKKSVDVQSNNQQNGFSSNMRSVLKSSFAKKGTRFVPLKPKISDRKIFKEEHFSSLINQSGTGLNPNLPLLKKSCGNMVKKNASKSKSLAVVAISSDKTKDLTEIVVSTAKGEHVFKGKTSELINATPNLWDDESSKNCEGSAVEDDEFLEYQPVTDALQRLGVPPLNWVQNKPEDQRMWYCPEKACKKLFPLLNQLKVHILGHYGVRPYKCDFPNCQWAFYTHFKLKRHKETHLQRKDYKCSFPECGRSFTTIYNLRTHQKLHKRPAEISCPVEDCSELFQTKRSLEFHLKEHGADHAPYICPYSSCQKRYYTVNSLNSHVRSHQHKDDEIKCQWSGCSKVFTKPCRLRAHMRTHTGDKPYLCTHPGCTWAFTSSSKLRRHQFKHTNVRNFQCRIDGCGKLFMRSEHLKEHVLTHSAERTFQCPHPNCNMKFSAKSSLYVHSKKHRAKVHAVSTESLTDAITSIPVNVIQSTNNVNIQSDLTSITDLSIEDQIAVQSLPSDNSVQSEISEATQTLDFIPLLSEDEALVAELASIEPVCFEPDAMVQLTSTNSNLPPEEITGNSPSVLATLPGYLDDSSLSSNMSQVLICSQDTTVEQSPTIIGLKDDLDQVLNPESARTSITINGWKKFKKMRQRQALPTRHQRQSRRHMQPPLKYKKSSQNSEEDLCVSTTTKSTHQEGLSNPRAPLDVVLGGSYLSTNHDSIAHLLLPDDLATSNDLYSSEDGILHMDSTFAPSTINLRDLE